MAGSGCFGQAQLAPALLCLSGHRGCRSFPGWRFYLGHGVRQPPPAAILGEFISSLFKLIFLFFATRCGGGENHSVTLPCVESEILLGFEPNDFFGGLLALMLGETASDHSQFPGLALSARRHPGCDFFEVQVSL